METAPVKKTSPKPLRASMEREEAVSAVRRVAPSLTAKAGMGAMASVVLCGVGCSKVSAMAVEGVVVTVPPPTTVSERSLGQKAPFAPMTSVPSALTVAESVSPSSAMPPVRVSVAAPFSVSPSPTKSSVGSSIVSAPMEVAPASRKSWVGPETTIEEKAFWPAERKEAGTPSAPKMTATLSVAVTEPVPACQGPIARNQAVPVIVSFE